MKEYPVVSARKIAFYFSKKKFEQVDILELLQGEYESRFKNGLCSGLVIENARHYMKYRQDEKANFIAKLRKKLSSNAAERSNFMKRIMLYQEIQPSRRLESDINLLDLNEYAIKKLDNKWLLYLSMWNDISSHSISIRTTPKTGNFLERQKYIIFDPNFGEYKANSFDECKDLLEKLMGFYNYNSLLSYDLEDFISKNNLAISTSDPKHTKDHKYIFNNPNAKDAKTKLLITAAKSNNLKILEELLKTEDLDVNSLDSYGNSALYVASEKNNVEIIKAILQIPTLDPNILNYYGNTALHMACHRNNAATVEALLKISTLDPNIFNSNGNTALDIASFFNYTDVVRMLLTRPDLDVNRLTNGHTALHRASSCNNSDVIRMLLTRPDLDVNSLNYDGNTALHRASEKNNVEAINALLQRLDLDPNIVNSNGETALHTALKNNNLEAIKALLQRLDLDPNILNSNGETALHIALKNKNIEAIKALLQRLDLDLNILNSYGKTALYMALMSNDLDIIKALLQRPDLDVNRLNYYGNTALHMALISNNLDIIKAILQIPTLDPNIVNSNGDTALHMASEKNNVKVIKAILQSPTLDPNILNSNGDTALHTALKNNNLEAIKALLQSPTLDPNILNYYGKTALHMALISNNLDIIKAILQSPTLDLYIFNSNGDTALHMALISDDLDIIKAILQIPTLDPNILNSNGDTALHMALMSDDLDIIKAFFQRPDLDVNIKYRDGNILDMLIENKSIEVIKLLIEDGRVNPPTLEQIHSITDSAFKSLLHAYFYKNKIMEELKEKVHNNDLAEEIDALPEDVKLELVNQLRSEIDKSKDLNTNITTKLISFLSQDFLPYSITPNREPIYHITQFLENDYPHYPINPYINSYNPLGINNSTSIPIITRFLDSIQQTPEAQINNLSSGLLGTILLFLTFRYKGTKAKKTQSEENLDPEQLIKQLEKLKSDGVSKADELKNKNIDNKITKLQALKEDDTIPENKKKFILKETSKVITALTKKRENPYSGIN